MATTKLDVKGKLEWAKVFESNRDRAEWTSETDGEYKVTVFTDKATADALKQAGCGKKIENTEDGYKVTFSRPHKGRQDWQGGAPLVADIAGRAWSVDDKGFIGNGSTGIVKVEVYDAGARKGTRLVGLQVLDHVVYQSEGGSSQPTALFEDLSEGQSAAVSSPSQEATDSIPF